MPKSKVAILEVHPVMDEKKYPRKKVVIFQNLIIRQLSLLMLMFMALQKMATNNFFLNFASLSFPNQSAKLHITL